MIDDNRVASFQKQQKELAYLQRDSNLQSARVEKQRWKAIHNAMRNYHPRG
jgi:ribosome biogenesis GTPase